MAIYEWVCIECNIWWDRDLPLGTAPKRTKCPECVKLCSRYYQQQNVGISFKDDGNCNKNSNANDFHTVRRRYEKVAKEGFDKDAGDRFLRRQILASKDSQDREDFRYKSAQIDYHKMAEVKGAKKLSDKEANQKMESSRKLTMDAYDKANKMGYKDIGSTNLDIAKVNKNEPTPQK